MSRYTDLKKAITLNDLAVLLGYKAKSLSYILYKIPDVDKYSDFTIPKKNGGERKICAPIPRLKKLQKRLADLLYECADDLKPELEKTKAIKGNNPKRNRAKRSISHGFQKGLSISSNAELHIRKRYVFNIDIEDFFPSFNFGRVRGYFIKNDKFKLNPKIATIIAQIACYNNELPQGSPCSPIISNFIAQILDVHLVRLANKNGCTYTRYADDLTFSTNLKVFPKKIAYKKVWSKDKWIVGKDIEKCIRSSGYEINIRKTHMQFLGSRQVVTGLVVNRVVNTTSEYYRYTRSMCNSLFTMGHYTFPVIKKNTKSSKFKVCRSLRQLKDKFIQLFIHNSKNSTKIKEVKNVEEKVETYGTINQIEGRLNYIYQIKNYRNKFAQPGYRKNRHDGYKKEKDKSGNHLYPPKNRCNQYSDESHLVAIDGIKNLYSKFLFFKYFHLLNKPLIFCEGKTDITYIRCALRQMIHAHPELIEKEGEKFKYKIKFFNRTETNSEILKLVEGVGGMKYIMLEYKRFMSKFRCEGQHYPVIMIVDNDKEGRELLSVKKNIENPIKGRKHHVFENLYAMSLPGVKGKKIEIIEDYFDKKTKSIKYKGKKFNPSNTGKDNKKEYGKHYFAEYVVKTNQDKISFADFKSLLDEISTVVKSHV